LHNFNIGAMNMDNVFSGNKQWHIEQGDCLTVLRSMPDKSVQCCVTSPPYWGLRDYGTSQWVGGNQNCEHGVRRWEGDKQTQGAQSSHASKRDRLDRCVCECGAVRIDRQFGLESTPEEYINNMVSIFREVRRVLRDDGTLWLNLGDSYAANRPGGQPTPTNTRNKSGHYGVAKIPYGLKPKDLIGIPWRVAFALQADGWYLRSDIIWHKPNAMPESVRDRPTKAHEYIFLLSKSERYYYEHEAIKEPAGDWGERDRSNGKYESGEVPIKGGRHHGLKGIPKSGNIERKLGTARCRPNSHLGGSVPWEGNTRNKRTVWTVATQPFLGAHFATFPPKLIEPCILAGCPEGGVVLDPFSGAGTTGLVALRHERQYIGIELNPEYVEMSKKRIKDDNPLFNGLVDQG